MGMVGAERQSAKFKVKQTDRKWWIVGADANKIRLLKVINWSGRSWM